jgi:hypothetical protein
MNRREFLYSSAAAALVPPAWPSSSGDPLHLDKYGLIVQANGNGGDTAQREGWAWFGSWIRSEILKNPWPVARPLKTCTATMGLLEMGQSGTFRRNPDPQWNALQDFSRDQTIPIVAAMGVWNDHARLERFWQKTVSRSYRAQNGDLMGTGGVNLFLRARNLAPGIIGDIQMPLDVAARINSSSSDKNDVGDDLNLIVILLMSKLRSSNDSTNTALAAYAKGRPNNYGCYLKSYQAKFGTGLDPDPAVLRGRMEAGIASGWAPECPRILGALRWYFRSGSGGNPELAELYAPIISHYFVAS